MHFKRVVLATDAVLRGSVDVVLSEAELGAAKGGGAIHFYLDCRVQVEELGVLLGNVEDGLLSRESDAAV